MHLVQITFHFEFWEKIEAILDERRTGWYVRFPSVQGKDRDGKHDNTRVFPGSLSVVQILMEDDQIDDLMKRLDGFRAERQAHRHLEAIILPVVRRL
jgi:hypothetical protein